MKLDWNKKTVMSEERFKQTNYKMSYAEYVACYCPDCCVHTCPHREAYRRFPEIDGGLGLCHHLKNLNK